MANVLADVQRGSAIPISRQVGLLALAIVIGYVIVRIIYVGYGTTRERVEASGAVR